MAKLLSGTRIYGNLVIDTWANAASANISGTTTSTSTTTGALVVQGGAGISGNISGNVAYGSQLTLAGNVNTALTITSLDTIAAGKPVKTLNIAAIDGTSAGIHVKSDGTKAYILGQNNDRVSELTLSTPYDITTGSNVGAASVLSQDTTARGVRFKPDGTKMYITGGTNNRVYEYTLSTPWQANTAANVGTFALTPTVVSPYGIEFNTDGSKMYVGQNAGNIAAFALATPWSVNSASYSAGLTVTSVETSLAAFSFNSTGTQLMLYGSNGKAFVVYTLGTAYDITTAVYTGQLRNDRPNQLSQTTIVGMHWLDTQNYFYVTDYQADEIVQYQTNIGGVSLSSASSTRFANTVVMDGSLLAGNIYTTGNIVTGGVTQNHYFGGTTQVNALTGTGTISFSSSTSTISIGGSQTTGNTVIGSSTQTGNVNIGPSTANVTYWNWYGATAANNTKNIIIGTGGLAGSFSNIQIGPLTGTGNVYFQAATQVNISNTQTSTSTTTGALVVQGGVGISGAVVAGAGTVSNPAVAIGASNRGFYNPTSGDVGFVSGGYEQVRYVYTGPTNDYITFTGAGTGNVAVIGTAGTDANVSLLLQPKGTTSNINLAANGAVVLSSGTGAISAIRYNALGSGYGTQPTITISAPTTAGGVTATANASIYLGGGTVVSGGTGYSVGDVLTVVGGSYTSQGYLTVTGNSSGVITSVTTTNGGAYYSFPANAVSVTGGTGSGATFNLLPGGVNSYNLLSGGSGYVEPPTITVTGGGGSGATAIATVGSGTTIKTLGSTVTFNTPSGSGFSVIDGGVTPVAWWGALGTNNVADLRTQGGGVTAGALTTQTAVPLLFRTNYTEQFRVAHTASAVNYVQVTGGATGGAPTISAQGSDTYVTLNLQSKAAPLVLSTRSTGTSFAVLDAGGTSTNYLTVFGPRVSGTGAILGASGTDANVAIVVQPKNYGNIDLNANAVVLTNGTGSITSITQTATGNLYLAAPTVTISTPQTQNGIQATANANIGVVFISNIQSAGTGYSVGNILTMVGNASTFSNATFTVTAVGNAVGGTGNVTALAITTSGSYNIANANPVTFTLAGTGAGTGLQVNVTYGVNAPVITNAGSGYVEQPTITISGGTGTANAAAYATVGTPTNITSLGANLSITLPQGEVLKVVTSPVILGVQSGNVTGANLGVGIYANTALTATALTGNAIAAGGVGIVGNVYGTSRIGFTWVANSSSAAYTVFNPGINSIDTYFG